MAAQRVDLVFLNSTAEDWWQAVRERKRPGRVHAARSSRKRLRDYPTENIAVSTEARRDTTPLTTGNATASSSASSRGAPYGYTGSDTTLESGPTVQQPAPLPSNALSQIGSSSRIARPLSPTFGALPTEAFETSDCKAALAAAHYCHHVVWPKFSVTYEVESSWFAAFCQYQAVFDGYAYATAVHKDIIQNRITLSNTKDVLIHKSKAIKAVSGMIADMDKNNGHLVEVILFAVTLLRKYDLTDDEVLTGKSLDFSPHLPDADWLTVFTRTTGAGAHRYIIEYLVDRLGGVRKLSFPGTDWAVSIADLNSSSIHFRKPRLPPYWTQSFDLVSQTLGLPYPILAGIGFRRDIPGGLPREAESVLTEMSALDTLLDSARNQELSLAQARTLGVARNSGQYRLLSLPPWQELTQQEQQGRHEAVYECCRITAVLYSNAVIFPLTTHTGWHLKIVAKLRQVVEKLQASDYKTNGLRMLLWSLFVGGIAARGSDRQYFTDTAKQVLVLSNLGRWDDVSQVLCAFLWSPEACQDGAASFYAALNHANTTQSTA